MPDRLFVVLDVGKTMVKASLWTDAGRLVRREARANEQSLSHGYPALDVAGVEVWLRSVLAEFARLGRVAGIIPVGHGAAAAIVRDGKLAAAPMDYEYTPPADLRESYLRQRDDFSITGSPAMGLALNLGLQLHCLEKIHPSLLTGDATILPWAQYWAWRLSGVTSCEVTSLGAHTDLWSPARQCASDMAIRRGWAARLAPLRHAHEALGPILPQWAHRTGLLDDVVVYVGVHDSNAALNAARAFPEFAHQDATLVSTGTWFVSMRSLGPGDEADLSALASERGCLVNVDVVGRPAPTALFMGGREIELLDTPQIDLPHLQEPILAALCDTIAVSAMILPTMAPGTGPFPAAQGRWLHRPADPLQAAGAVALYAALMSDVALDLIGANGPLLVDGRFARSEAFIRALASLRPDARVYVAGSENDVSFGALRLLLPELGGHSTLTAIPPLDVDLEGYRAKWRERAAQS